jgi:hypothetical protein
MLGIEDGGDESIQLVFPSWASESLYSMALSRKDTMPDFADGITSAM